MVETGRNMVEIVSVRSFNHCSTDRTVDRQVRSLPIMEMPIQTLTTECVQTWQRFWSAKGFFANCTGHFVFKIF